MTPTLTLIASVMLFWTIPATAAVFVYRKHGSSMENVKAAAQESMEGLLGTPQPELQKSAAEA